jgi:hypothetical protein
MMIDELIPGACSAWGVHFPHAPAEADTAAGTDEPAPAAVAAAGTPDVTLPERLRPVT